MPKNDLVADTIIVTLKVTMSIRNCMLEMMILCNKVSEFINILTQQEVTEISFHND